MTPDADRKIRRVVSSNGRVWHTNAQSAADYLFNPVFMTFFILCVVLYATLVQSNEETSIPYEARLVLWIGLVMTSLIWLYLSVSASVIAYDRGLLKAIYTPLILLPLVLMNAFMEEFVLSVLNVEFRGSYVSALEYAVRNAIILIVLDIMHGRFVVPEHPRYVDPERERENAIGPALPEPEPITEPSKNTTLATSETSSMQADGPARLKATHKPENTARAVAAKTSAPTNISIAREKIDISTIVWIKSVDHYLNLQLKDRNLMLRGKLRMVVDKLGDQLGVQINRSVWVAFDAIRNVEESENGNLEVHLEDDSCYTVAKARCLIFKQNYRRFKAGNAGLAP